MVAGGHDATVRPSDWDKSYIEIIHLINPKLSFTFRDTRLSKVHLCNGGGILQNQLIICGGRQVVRAPITPNTPIKFKNDIVVLGQQNKLANNKLLESRGYSKSVVLNDEKIWTIGGHNSTRHTRTTEFVFLDQSPVKGPDLPFRLISHVVIKVDEKCIFILGGYQNVKPSNETWIVDPTNNFDIKKGPSMKAKRVYCSGSTMNLGGKQYILVAGGHGKVSGETPFWRDCYDTTELLDISMPGQEWIEGMHK